MKLLNVFIDRLPEIGGASAGFGGSIAFITWGSVLTMFISALIFTVIGGVVGYFVKKILDKVFKK